MKIPQIEATSRSMFTTAGYLAALTLAAAVAAVVLKLVVGILALGAIVFGLAGIVLAITRR